MSNLVILERRVSERQQLRIRPLTETSRRGDITMTPPLTPTITAFEKSPDRGRGLARDTRVRWALEEVGQPYEVRLVSFGAMKEPAHRAFHPFGQSPPMKKAILSCSSRGRS